MLPKWKQTFLAGYSQAFEDPRKKDPKVLEKEIYIGELEKKVGQLTLERDWLKKNLTSSLYREKRKSCILRKDILSMRRQSELLMVSRKTAYSNASPG